MQKVNYVVARPVVIDHQSLSVGDVVKLYPRAAQFWLADGTLEHPKKKGNGA